MTNYRGNIRIYKKTKAAFIHRHQDTWLLPDSSRGHACQIKPANDAAKGKTFGAREQFYKTYKRVLSLPLDAEL